jgi:hypothetical protein
MIHSYAAQLHYYDLVAEAAAGRLAAQARLTATSRSAGARRRWAPYGYVRSAARRVLAAVTTIAPALSHR